MLQIRRGTSVILLLVVVSISMDVTFQESESFYPSPQLQGENNQEAESSELSVLPIIPLLHDLETSPELSVLHVILVIHEPLMPNEDGGDVPIPVHNNVDRYKLQFQRKRWKGKSVLPQQVQSHEPEVSVPNPEPSNSCEANLDDLPIALRKEKRYCTKYPISQFVSTEKLFVQHQSFISAIDSIRVPTLVQEALKDKNWIQAMNEEMHALEKNGTWDIIEKPNDKRPIGCKWIYTVKYRSDGTLDRYKARLVAKGYTQAYGIDYEEIFALVAKMNTVRIILSLAAHFDWELQQFDVKNAFLHGDLEEEVYMEIPPGYDPTSGSNKVCRLKKAIYGLKQSPRTWLGRLIHVMVSLGYKQSQGDHTLFIKHAQNGKLTLLLIYVDDMIITGNDEFEKKNLRKELAAQFEM